MVHDELKNNYHAYLSKAERVPQLMRGCGLFSTDIRIEGRNTKNEYVQRLLTFYQGGTVSVDGSKAIPFMALDSLLEMTFANYRKPKTLNDVAVIAMKTLNDALFEVEKECEQQSVYRK